MAVEAEVAGVEKVNPADQWVATDALGRKLPTFEEVGPRRPEKIVGVFYYVWVGNQTRKVVDISEILKQEPSDRQWGKRGAFHFWGEPEYGFYHASDPWVIRHDLQMLTNAGVDFLYFDVTNALIYEDTVKALLKVSSQMRESGIATPDLCFTTHAGSGTTINQVYDAFYTDPKWKDHWFHWEGKPLILGDADDKELRPELKEFFTIKFSWAWTDPAKPEQWQWLDNWPQDFAWKGDPGKAVQIPVSTAQHPTSSQGKSLRNGISPTVNPSYVTQLTDRGIQFQEQWDRALDVDPQVVMVTQWNEWIAQRFINGDSNFRENTFAGRPTKEGESYFVDVFSREFNRDIAPMKGGYTDNYYYQLIANVRKFKGMTPFEPRPPMTTIQIDGNFDDWRSVKREHIDPVGDTRHRDFEGTDPKTRYTNDSGRNDIIRCKAVRDKDYVYFNATTQGPLTPHRDRGWMFLLIDSDQEKSTGWQGYDLLINSTGESSLNVRILSWIDEGWKTVGTSEMAYQGSELELRVPSRFLGQSGDGFDFKWCDNAPHLNDATAFFLDGDSAPDRRFNFRF